MKLEIKIWGDSIKMFEIRYFAINYTKIIIDTIFGEELELNREALEFMRVYDEGTMETY